MSELSKMEYIFAVVGEILFNKRLEIYISFDSEIILSYSIQ